jgi:hypothetical protein
MLNRIEWRRRGRAAGIHLLISCLVAALAAALVFGLWYPGAYLILAGGRELFLLVVTVDVILGPLLTFAVFDLKKPFKSLRRDLAVIGLLQMAALVYGLHTVYIVRPVAMVFEVDRFRVVAASQVHLSDMPSAREQYRHLPLSGPWLLGTRTPEPGAEHTEALFLALQEGVDRGYRPRFWQPYPDSVADVAKKARPLSRLFTRYPEIVNESRRALRALGVSESEATFLPVMGRGGDWVVILDRAHQPRHFVRADGFF